MELKRWAWNRDLYDIMLSVNNALRAKDIAINNKQSVKQVLEMHLTSPTKKLYFNPGYYVKTNISTSTADEATTSAAASTSNGYVEAYVRKNESDRNLVSDQPNENIANAENTEPVRKRRKKQNAPRTKREFKLGKGQTVIDQFFKKQKTSDGLTSTAKNV